MGDSARISDLALDDVELLPEQMDAAEAYTILERAGNPAAVLRRGRVIGVVSLEDLGGPSGAAARAGRTVGEFIFRPLLTVGANATLDEAGYLLRGMSSGCVPVLDQGRVVGLLAPWMLLTRLASRTVDQESNP